VYDLNSTDVRARALTLSLSHSHYALRSPGHKWKFPDAAVCTSQLNYFAAGSTTQPGSLTRNSDNVMCSDEENPSDMVESSNANAGFQVIFSLSARDKVSDDLDRRALALRTP